MECKQAGRQEGRQGIAEYPPGHAKQQPDDCGVKQDVGQMEAVGQRAEELIADQVAEGHQRAIVVRDALRALERPDRGAEDLAEVMEAADVGILNKLRIVVIDKAAGQGIGVGHDGQEEKKRKKRGVRSERSARWECRGAGRALAIEHPAMLLDEAARNPRALCARCWNQKQPAGTVRRKVKQEWHRLALFDWTRMGSRT